MEGFSLAGLLYSPVKFLPRKLFEVKLVNETG